MQLRYRYRVYPTPGQQNQLPKIGDVTVVWSRELPSEPSSVTIVKDASGRYFASFVVQVEGESMLEEEAARYGRTFHKVDRWFPSSRTCSACGRVDWKKPLSVREWSCPAGLCTTAIAMPPSTSSPPDGRRG